MKRLMIASLAAAGVLVGCGEPEPVSVNTDTVLADYSGGQIRLNQVDEFLLSQQSRQRWPAGRQSAQWLGEVVRHMAVDRLLLQEADLIAADQDPEFKRKNRLIERNAYSDYFLMQQTLAEDLQLTEEKLRGYFEDHQDSYQFPEQRNVYNIYKSFHHAESPESVVAELEQLRQRHLNGENFQTLAQQYSESETRHRSGYLGLIQPGRISDDFDRVVFSLNANSVSDVVRTADGAHLFYVADILEAQNNEFEDVQALVFQQIRASLLIEQLQSIVAGLPQPEPFQLPERERFHQALRNGPPRAVLLSVGEFRMNKAQFNEYMGDIRRQIGPRQIDDLAYKLLQEIAYREAIFQHVKDQGLPDAASQQLALERDRQLAEHYLETKLKAYLADHPDQLRDHYDNNQMRFATPLSVRIDRLVVPLTDQPANQMAALEQARTRLDNGEITLEQLKEQLGGEIQEAGLVSAARLRQIDPVAARFAFVLDTGQHSPPYRRSEFLALFRVSERKEPSAQPLAMVRERVVQDYLDNYASRLYVQFADEFLSDNSFSLKSEVLDEAVRAIALPGI